VDSRLTPLDESQTELVAELTRRWGLGSSTTRVTEALAAYA
jgi:hypothetical protein